MPATSTILPDEQLLFEQMAEGNDAAFHKIFLHYSDRIYTFILNKTKSEDIAQELTQEIFIKIWVNRNQLANVDNYAAYIFKMAAHQAYMHFRKASRDHRVANEWYHRIEQLRNTTEEWMDAREHQDLISRAVQQLPPQRRKIYELSRMNGLSHAEIAKELNISPSTVNNQLNEALKSIRKFLNGSPELTVAIVLYLMQEVNK
jgi:RNA polymerase sigma-70 factor (family 1)